MTGIIGLLGEAPCTIVATLALAVLLVVKTRRHEPLVGHASTRKTLVLGGFLLAVAGLGAVVVLAGLARAWSEVDIALGALLLGTTAIGLAAETSQDPTDNVL